MYFISYGASFMGNNGVFRLPWGLQMIPAILLLAFLPMIPRSPRWLASQDRWEEATGVLAQLHGKGNTLDPIVVAQVHEIREKIESVVPCLPHMKNVKFINKRPADWSVNIRVHHGWNYSTSAT